MTRLFVLMFLGSLLKKLARDIKEEMEWCTAATVENQSGEKYYEYK